jgi:hypothetical protein
VYDSTLDDHNRKHLLACFGCGDRTGTRIAESVAMHAGACTGIPQREKVVDLPKSIAKNGAREQKVVGARWDQAQTWTPSVLGSSGVDFVWQYPLFLLVARSSYKYLCVRGHLPPLWASTVRTVSCKVGYKLSRTGFN